MVEYALASEGAGVLIDRDTCATRKWPENEEEDEVYKHCGCTMITKCSVHDDYSTYKFLLSDPLSTQSEIWSYRREQNSNRPQTIGNYILFHELLDRYPYYFLRGSSKTGDTFYRQKGARFNYVPPYRVCANELYHKQKQWILKEAKSESKVRPLSAPPTPTPRNEQIKKANEQKFLPTLVTRKNLTAHRSTARSYHRNNYFYDMVL